LWLLCVRLHEARQRGARAALQRHQKSVIGLVHAMLRMQVVLDAAQQLGGHLGVGQSPVRPAGARQLEKINQ
jgi:hypothetical protein